MKNSLGTWTNPHRKPIEIHHDDFADPIGRVISSSYVPYGAPEGSTQDCKDAFDLLHDASSQSDVLEAVSLL
jgi:hypothetical protein